MKQKSFKEILLMVDNACSDVFYNLGGMTNITYPYTAIIESATKIYIAQTNGNSENEVKE